MMIRSTVLQALLYIIDSLIQWPQKKIGIEQKDDEDHPKNSDTVARGDIFCSVLSRIYPTSSDDDRSGPSYLVVVVVAVD